VLIEKPLALNASDLAAWLQLSNHRQAPILVCHNYRYKSNVLLMLSALEQRNSGRLLNVHLHFESPSVTDASGWRKNERVAQTLLMDFGLHFLDLACMFNSGTWKLRNANYRLNSDGQTKLITGEAMSDEYSVSFLMRQGFGPRRCTLHYTFANYSIELGFFPDTCVLHASDYNFGLNLLQGASALRATLSKVKDKLTNQDSDLSHAGVYHGLLNGDPCVTRSLRVESLANFYRLAFQIADTVYGQEPQPGLADATDEPLASAAGNLDA
jgi:hypothetical protein